VADKNEVIYVANTTAATDLGNGLDAASNAAITTTRATIFPNTNTTTVISGDFQTQTTTTVFSEVSSEINFGTSNLFFSEQQGVVEYGSLPHQTELQQVAYATTAQTTTSFAFASNSTTITKTTAAETVCVLSFAAVSEYLNGQGFGAITTATSTLSSKYAPTAAQTRTFSSTQEITTPTAIETTTNSGTGTRTTTSLSYYTWTASYNSTISDALTTFARRDCGVTTSSNSCKTRQEYMSGVVDESGGLALGYSLQANLGVGSGDPFVSVEPYLLSAFPSSFVFASEIPEEGDITYTSVTFSHLSATIKAPGTGNSSSTAALETFGSPIRHYRLGNFFSSRMESGLAQNQTGYITVPGGVYYADGSTFSTPGQTTSFTKGELSAAAPRPISYIVGTPDRASANQIYWTATRNSFAQP
jgi:hypothetical protein